MKTKILNSRISDLFINQSVYDSAPDIEGEENKFSMFLEVKTELFDAIDDKVVLANFILSFDSGVVNPETRTIEIFMFKMRYETIIQVDSSNNEQWTEDEISKMLRDQYFEDKYSDAVVRAKSILSLSNFDKIPFPSASELLNVG